MNRWIHCQYLLILNSKSSDALSWGLRLEYMMLNQDDDDVNVFTPTLTGNYSVGNLTIKPELRLDSASEDIFLMLMVKLMEV